VRLLFVHEVNWRAKVVYEIHDYPELLSFAGHEAVFIDFPEGETCSGFTRFPDLRARTTIETGCNWDSCLKQVTGIITDCVDVS